ncbi:uncharacterized protein TNCV_1371171 [Trichonephila clavipes]|nr:uncharacterized protein TNCV_1371171 [Trichonephila clavipes]
MFSRRSVLLDCVLRIISQNTYGGTLRRINAGMQESLRWTHNKYKMDTVITKIPVKVRCMKEEDIPHVMEMRRQLRVHDVPTFLQTWIKIDPEGMFVALTEDVVIDAVWSAVGPGEGMNICKFIIPLRHGGTLNSRRVTSSLMRLVEREEKWEAFTPLSPQFVPLKCSDRLRTRTDVQLALAMVNFVGQDQTQWR